MSNLRIVIFVPDPAADRHRHEQIFAELRDFLEARPAIVGCRSDVENDQLVHIPAFEKPDAVHHRAYAAAWVELLSFDASVVVPEKHWNDAGLDAHRTTSRFVKRSQTL
jgi:hypothetical protein